MTDPSDDLRACRPALEAAQHRMGNWTFDDIAEAVLRNDDISVSLTEAILATLDQVRALLSAAKEVADLNEEINVAIADKMILRSAADRMREALQNILCCTPQVRDGEIIYDCGDPFELARAALLPAGEET